MTGEGEGGSAGAPPGDLYVVVHLRPHKIFERDDDNLYRQLDVSMVQAALGETVLVDTLTDGPVELNLPDGAQTGEVLRLKGLGMPHLRDKGRGHLFVQLVVRTPRKLSKKQKELLRELPCWVIQKPPNHRKTAWKRPNRPKRKKDSGGSISRGPCLNYRKMPPGRPVGPRRQILKNAPPKESYGLTHVDEKGAARMVDVGQKPITRRLARAQGRVRLAPATIEMISQGGLPQGRRPGRRPPGRHNGGQAHARPHSPVSSLAHNLGGN